VRGACGALPLVGSGPGYAVRATLGNGLLGGKDSVMHEESSITPLSWILAEAAQGVGVRRSERRDGARRG
jgi:hypothetical protein